MHFFNKPLRLLLYTNGLILLAGALLGPIYALFVDDLGGSLLDASITGGIFALAAGFMSLYSGKLTDSTRNPKIIVSIGYLLMAIGFFSYSFVRSIYVLFLVQILIGFGEAIYSPAFDSLYSKHLAKTKRGRGWGAWESLNYFTAGIGAVLGGVVATLFGFTAIFYMMGTLCLASSIRVYFTTNKTI